MDVPIEIVVLVPISIGTLSVIVAGFFMNKLNKHIDEYRLWQSSIYNKFDTQEDKLIEAIECLGNKVTPMIHCDGKQREWQLRFDAMMAANEKQHQDIVTAITKLISSSEEMRKCINLMQSEENAKC